MSTLLSEHSGTITVSAAALSSIVVSAAESVDGVRVRRGRRRLDVTLSEGRARVELELAVRLGVVLPEAARSVQERVAEALGEMCEVVVDAVDVTVEEVE